MMFLEFFIWGAWFVTLGTFLANNLDAADSQIALAFATQSWGAIIAPFIVGLIADRFFNAERILGFIHLIGAVLMYQMANATDFSMFYPYVLGYMILFMPTLATYGIGMLIGFWAAGQISEAYVTGETHAWMMIWIIPAIFAAVIFFFYWVAFKPEDIDYDITEVEI